MSAKSWMGLLAAGFLAALTVGQAGAQDAQKQNRNRNADRTDATVTRTETDATKTTGMRHSMRASELIGMEVQNAQGENLGEIEDLVIDAKTGKVRYAALSFGGFLGIGDKLFAVPMQAMKMSRNEDNDWHFVMNVDKQRLRDAPGFNKDQWPDFANSQWSADVDAFYGTFDTEAEDSTTGAATDRTSRPGATRTDRNRGAAGAADQNDANRSGTRNQGTTPRNRTGTNNNNPGRNQGTRGATDNNATGDRGADNNTGANPDRSGAANPNRDG